METIFSLFQNDGGPPDLYEVFFFLLCNIMLYCLENYIVAIAPTQYNRDYIISQLLLSIKITYPMS